MAGWTEIIVFALFAVIPLIPYGQHPAYIALIVGEEVIFLLFLFVRFGNNLEVVFGVAEAETGELEGLYFAL
jgi:hypothetical protein